MLVGRWGRGYRVSPYHEDLKEFQGQMLHLSRHKSDLVVVSCLGLIAHGLDQLVEERAVKVGMQKRLVACRKSLYH